MVEASLRSVGYEVLRNIARIPSKDAEVNVAIAIPNPAGPPIATTRQEVVIKTYARANAEKANNEIIEAIIQTRVEHPSNCRLIELKLQSRGTKSPGIFVHLVMEKLEFDLMRQIQDRQDQDRPYSEKELEEFLVQVGSGLAYAKTKNIAHMDIKPANIFVDAEGHFKVGDFGSAWEKIYRSVTQREAGTPAYFSPEQRNACLTPGTTFRPFESDIFSLGITLLHLAKLSPPELSVDVAELPTQIQREISDLQYSEGFKNLLMRMLAIDPRKRPTIEDVLKVFRQPSAPGEEVKAVPRAQIDVQTRLQGDVPKFNIKSQEEETHTESTSDIPHIKKSISKGESQEEVKHSDSASELRPGKAMSTGKPKRRETKRPTK